MRVLRAGTRASNLARTQTDYVIAQLKASHPALEIESEVISTQGDRVLDRPLAEIGGKGVFTLELETALRDGSIDFAVHSLKDLPTDPPEGLAIGAVPPRASALDAFVSPRSKTLRELPNGSRIGTSSLRRKAQLRALNPTWEVVDIRGNVETRLRKIDDGIVDAAILASAGLDRLGKSATITERIAPELMLPACGQGALAVQVREDDDELHAMFAALHDAETAATTSAERRFLASLGGGCLVPIGALALVDGDALHLRGCVCSLDGRHVLRAEVRGSVLDAVELGELAARQVLTQGAERLIAEIR